MVSRAWTWTAFRYTEVDTARLLGPDIEEDVKYLIFQEEIAPGTGRPHLQGYVVLRRPRRRAAVVDILQLQGAHCEIARGGHEDNIRYCSKQESRDPRSIGPYERGTRPGAQGQRTDLDALRRAIDRGDSFETISGDHFSAWIRYERGIRSRRALTTPRRTWPTEVRVYWGPTATGKTRCAWDEAGPRAYILPAQQGATLWADGYNGEEHVIIDDFYGNMRADVFLHITDRYPMLIQVKHGFVQWCPKIIWITSNTDPQLWYRDVPASVKAAIMRRLTIVREFGKVTTDQTTASTTQGGSSLHVTSAVQTTLNQRATTIPWTSPLFDFNMCLICGLSVNECHCW